MDTNFYDVVVCGSELAGLVAAALLGRRGFRVLLVGHDADRASFEAGGHVLAREPGLLPPLETTAVARVLQELNYVQILRRRAPAPTPSFQVAFPHHRIDVTADSAALGRELERELPADRAAIEAALARLAGASATLDPLLGSEVTLPPDGFWERREVARFESLLPAGGADLLAPLPQGHLFRAAIAAPAAFLGGFGPGDLGTLGQARLFDVARRGLHHLAGGYAALRALFTDKVGSYAGEIREKVTPVEIVQKRARAVGIRVRPRDETIGCSHLLWAAPLADMLHLSGDKPPSRKLRDESAGLRPACYRYSLCMLLRPEAIPEGMSRLVYAVRDPTRPLIEENAFAVTVGEPAARAADKIPVWVQCLVPGAAVDAGPGYLGALRGRLRGQVARLLPFFARHLIVLASPHDGLPPELPGGRAAAAPATPVPAQPMAAVYSSDLPRALDVGGAPHATGIKNLYLIGRENLPGLGVEGELISAWSVARSISASQPKRDLLRREVLLDEG